MTKVLHPSICRICAGACGVVVTTENGKVTDVRGDHDHALSRGYACIKGLSSGAAHHAEDRILTPLKKMPNGSFEAISLSRALDEIADRLKMQIEAYGPRSIATFKGTQGYMSHSLAPILPAWMAAIGSPNLFSTMTIDQSAKIVSMGRLGMWGAGRHHFQDSDVTMIVGGNPLVSISVQGITPFNITKQFKDARTRGHKLIVIDPRVSETAKFADIHLQVIPGQDAVLLAAIIREILANGWEDQAFCRDYVVQLEELRAAVEPATLALAEKQAGVPRALIAAAAKMFASDSKRGTATTGTGPSLSPHSNLSEHLVEVLNVICGRFNRAGEMVRNPGLLRPAPAIAEVIPPNRHWEHGPKSNVRGFGCIGGEMPSATLPEEILEADESNRIRALFVSGGNPAMAFPDQERTVESLKALELLVVVDPFMTATAKLADYIIAPTMMYERSDVMLGPDFESFIPERFQQYSPAILSTPEGSELIDDWRVFWELCKRLNVQINYYGHALDMINCPTSDELLGLCMENSPIGVEELKMYPRGHVFDLPPEIVREGRISSNLRFQVMPQDVEIEMREAVADATPQGDFILVSRRIRETMNTLGINWPGCRKRRAFNPVWMHPHDAAGLGLEEGDSVTISSDHGALSAIIELDDSTRRGVVAMTHCWGDLPDADPGYLKSGANTNLLTDLVTNCQTINAMPVMSSFPVKILRADGV
jgi:anaerobic selenocysteine-containing dehydrogenase